jgi:hypothetical protein
MIGRVSIWAAGVALASTQGIAVSPDGTRLVVMASTNPRPW